jgi:hypothetical protein
VRHINALIECRDEAGGCGEIVEATSLHDSTRLGHRIEFEEKKEERDHPSRDDQQEEMDECIIVTLVIPNVSDSSTAEATAYR